MKPAFFASPALFRQWMERHHANTDEFWVGFYKRNSGRPSMSWPESVDVALCFGWIDGVRKSIDATSYVIRFTPRRARSFWSAVNIRKIRDLQQQGLLTPVGLAAFEQRAGERSGVYAYEQSAIPALPDEYQQEFRENLEAWEFFQKQAAWYRRTASWWIVSAKKEETKRKRLAELIRHSAMRQSIPRLARTPKQG